MNDFQTQFIRTHEGASDLICITTEYTDPMLTAYTDRIAPLLDPALRLMWTGPALRLRQSMHPILQPSTRNTGARYTFGGTTRSTMCWRITSIWHRARGLDKKLAEAVSGFVANPMNQGHASLYPLFTVADYLWNPTAYDADRSARAAATYLAGNAADAAMTFIDLCRRLPAERGMSRPYRSES